MVEDQPAELPALEECVMEAMQRVRTVLAGRRPDRPPVSFWCHFPPDQVAGRAAVQAHLDHVQGFGLDFLKVMNDQGYPHSTPVQRVGDLATVPELRGDEPLFARQLELVAALRAELHGQVPLVTTIFNTWTVLRHLIEPPTVHTPPDLHAKADGPSQRIKAFLAEDPAAVRGALGRIGTSLARFATRCLAAGADGVFLSVRDDWVDTPGPGQPASLYAELVRPTDLAILAAASAGWFNLLHVCGKAVHFRALAGYPVHALNWADRAAGPAIAEVKAWAQPALCAGVDNLGALPAGTPQDCAHQVVDALRQAGDRPILIAAGCTYDATRVPRANLEAVVQAAHAAGDRGPRR